MDYYTTKSKNYGQKGGVAVQGTNSVFIGKQVRNARKEAKLTQSELGSKIGRTKQWVSELERGNIRLTYEHAVQISSACGTTTDFFSTKVHKS